MTYLRKQESLLQKFNQLYNDRLRAHTSNKHREQLFSNSSNIATDRSAKLSANDQIAAEHQSLTISTDHIDESLERARRTREALSRQRETILSSGSRIKGVIGQVANFDAIRNEIHSLWRSGKLVKGILFGSILSFILWWHILQ